MSDATVSFFYEDVQFDFQYENIVRSWLYIAATKEMTSLAQINYIFCSNPYLLGINKQYLNHDYFTDVITFPMMEEGQPVEADIFISVDTVRSNAVEWHTSFDDELFRVIIHGLLHCFGYQDKTKEQQELMTQKEDFYLALLKT